MSDAANAAIPSNPSEHACLDLVNSAFSDHVGSGGTVDRLASPAWQRWFLDRHGLKPKPPAGPPPVADLVALRRDLRRILERWSSDGALGPRDVGRLDRWTRAAELRERVVGTASGVAIETEPLHRDWAWVHARVAASAVRLLADGGPRRLKTCGNPPCGWMFYDDTVNRSKRFCSTTPCASRVRVRRFRRER